MRSIIVYTERTSKRLDYIVHHLFHSILGYEVSITTSAQNLSTRANFCINYSTTPIPGALQIVPHTLLFESGIHPQVVTTSMWDSLPTLFPSSGHIPFDILSASFYLISRYEEYLPSPLDKHSRYSHLNSIAHKCGFLQRPLIDLWAIHLAAIIEHGYTSPRQFRFTPTIDIDNFYKYRRKGICPTTALFARDLIRGNFHEIRKRWLVVTYQLKDPYFNFETLELLHSHYGLTPRYFFHVGGVGRWDMHTLLPLWCIRYRKEVKKLSIQHHIGIHPSYNAGEDPKRLRRERKRIEKWTGKRMKRSRFHFLKMTLPQSYRMLADEGILSDYSMLYPNAIGFRASTSIPFHFYDVERDEIRDIRIHPTVVMDTALIRLHKEGEEKLFAQVCNMLHDVQEVHGDFVTLYHNQNLTYERSSEWNRRFYKSLLHAIRDEKMREGRTTS